MGSTLFPLQAQRVHKMFPKPSRAYHSSERKPHSTPSPSATTPSSTPGSRQQPLLDRAHLEPSQMGLPAGHQQEFARQANSTPSLPWSFQRSKSLFCLPTEDPSSAASAIPECFSNKRHWASEWKHAHLLSIDDLEGAQETDVDTGLRLSSSDLSVVSAYSAPSRFCSSLESPLPSERCGHHWPKYKCSIEGPLSTGSEVAKETSWASLPFFTKRPYSSSVTVVAAPPASGAASVTESSPELPGDAPNAKWTGRDVPPPPALAGPWDNDTEEFYI